jgi:hypothetical protein
MNSCSGDIYHYKIFPQKKENLRRPGLGLLGKKGGSNLAQFFGLLAAG